MPYPLNPPPQSDTGALTYPRTLQRWLDDNPVSKLTRVSTFINLPVFQQTDSSWNGYTDIVYAYNFEGPNNFSLKPFKAPSKPNYSLCVSWNFAATGQVVRYVLWLGVGATSPLQAPMYSGQPILKNFRFEIWNTSAEVVSNITPVQFFTSKLGGQDYRWAVDYTLVANDPQVNQFNNTNPSTIAPPFDPYEIFYGDTGLGFSAPLVINTWTGTILNTVLTSNVSSVNASISPVPPIAPPRASAVQMFEPGFPFASAIMQGQFISNKIAIFLSFSDFNELEVNSNIINTGSGGIFISVIQDPLNDKSHILTAFGQNGKYALQLDYNYIIIVDSLSQVVYLMDGTNGAQLDTIVGVGSTPYNSGSTTILGPGSASSPVNPDSLVSGGVPLESGGQPILK